MPLGRLGIPFINLQCKFKVKTLGPCIKWLSNLLKMKKLSIVIAFLLNSGHEVFGAYPKNGKKALLDFYKITNTRVWTIPWNFSKLKL